MRPNRRAVEAVLRRHTGDLLEAMAEARTVPRAVYRTLRRELRDLGATRREAWKATRALRRKAKDDARKAKAAAVAPPSTVGEAVVEAVFNAAVEILFAALN